MERGAVGSEEEDDGGEAASCRIQARASAAGHREESAGRGSKGLQSFRATNITLANVWKCLESTEIMLTVCAGE